MKISIVTSVFLLRKSRPIDFYLKPANDFLLDMANSNIDIHLYTNLEKSKFVQAGNIFIKNESFDNLIQYFWNDSDWRNIYSKALESRSSDRFEEKLIPELLSIWLGKFEMIYQASLNSDCVLWQDSGIRNYIFNKNIDKYVKKRIFPFKYQSVIEEMLGNNSIVLLAAEDSRDDLYHGVNMKEYSDNKQYCRAGFILSKSEEISNMRDSIKFYWNKLISNKHYGTEENPLTMFYWSNPNVKIYKLNEWLSLFDLDERNVKFL